jgi:hypothetical protein
MIVISDDLNGPFPVGTPGLRTGRFPPKAAARAAAGGLSVATA